MLKSSNIGALAKLIMLYVGTTYPDIEKQSVKLPVLLYVLVDIKSKLTILLLHSRWPCFKRNKKQQGKASAYIYY